MLHGAGFVVRREKAVFLGEDILAWLVLAIGGAMAVGNVAALVGPATRKKRQGDLPRPPLGRSLVFVVLGLVAAIWALVSLVNS